jgi:hypothetical protein
LSWDIDHSRFPRPGPIETVSLGFGHFWPEVPETLHIGAHPCIFMWNWRHSVDHKRPANKPIESDLLTDELLIAMQKVEGSNPFSRFM